MKKLITPLLLAIVLMGCTTETYDSGDGKYSYLRADFVEFHTSQPQLADYAINDDGERISMENPFSVKWANKGDSLYRALFYYNLLPRAASKPLALMPVYVLWPKESESVENKAFDPVVFESAWLSTCQRSDLLAEPQYANEEPRPIAHYLNLSFLVKSGQPDDESARQSIGIMSEQADDGSLRLMLLHDQGSVPQYYSTRIYASIPLSDGQLAQSVTLVINTYDGILSRQF